jgi:uncharacterized Zn-finger protein
MFIAVSEVGKTEGTCCLVADNVSSPGHYTVRENVQQQFFGVSTPLASVTGPDVPYSCFDAAQESQSAVRHPGLRSHTPGAKSKLYPCKRCGRAYMWKKTLLRHLRMECGKEPQFQCPYCPQKSKLKGNLKQHIMCKHVSLAADYNRSLPL